MSNASSSPSQTPSRWQTNLSDACEERQMSSPSYQIFSDRRGGRTAWSAHVTVVDATGSPRTFHARNWYSGEYVNNAKEDAAELALKEVESIDMPEEQQVTETDGS
ncbi:MAG: hypothetical protein Q9162_001484 [Coniocarpon cinnabarinum]